jgi:transcriptional regulator GlxA family with amidase domain
MVLAVSAVLLPALPLAAGEPPAGVLRCAFVCVNGVFNSELIAPYDVLEHSRYRDEANYIETFIVSPGGAPFVTAEGITIQAHYSFENAPAADILVIPSTETSMSDDLENERYMSYVKRAVAGATWVITVCDGAFPLAATGELDGRSATTFPSDREALAKRYPRIDVRTDARIVVDGKYITSVGGGMSYEPALWLVERLYGPEHASRTARGLVWPWDPGSVPTLVK